jgi:uncharacterized membrane protein YjjP (DUF1212 family)
MTDLQASVTVIAACCTAMIVSGAGSLGLGVALWVMALALGVYNELWRHQT